VDIAAAHQIVLRQGWLSQTPPSFQHEVLDRCQLRHFASGEFIYSVGDPPGGMFGLASGALDVSIAPNERGPYFTHVARQGTWFGEAAAFTGQPRRVGLAAARDSELLHLPLHGIDEIVGKDPGAWRFFALVTIGHLDVTIGAHDDLMIRDHVKRCIAVLLRLGGCRQASPTGSIPIEVDASQDDIALMSNVARTTAGTVLRKLEAMGHLEQSYRRIHILAPDGLRAMLED
jgi:CRP/FNR family transcriptional regulator, cyclic AMP receptor protein